MTTVLILFALLALAGVAFFFGLICGGGLTKAAQAEPLLELGAARADMNELCAKVAEMADLNQQILALIQERQHVAIPIAFGRPN